MYAVLTHEKAIKEYLQSIEWYEKQLPGLGERFEKAFIAKREQIKNHPEYFSFIKGKYRQAKIDNFPFVIVYEVFPPEQIIHIASIFHGKRNPKKKFRRRK